MKAHCSPKSDQWKWNVERNQEGFWFGDVNAGMQCLFRAENYRRPLNTNFYKMQPLNMPPSWFTNGKGGISYKEKGNQVDIKTYSGSRTLQKGEELNFDFLVLVTPFKPIDTMKQWTDRYYHGYQPAEKLKEGDAHAYQAVRRCGRNRSKRYQPASRQCGESAYQLSFLPPCLHEAVRRRIACQRI